MKVTPTGESGFRFWVESADDEDPYLVDLTGNKGMPVCTCKDNMCRKQPELFKTRKIVRHFYTGATICKHVDAAVFYVGMLVLANNAGKRVDEIYKQYTRKELENNEVNGVRTLVHKGRKTAAYAANSEGCQE